MRLRISMPITVLFVMLLSISSSAQWLNEPDPRLPRTQDGKPILTANAPHTRWQTGSYGPLDPPRRRERPER